MLWIYMIKKIFPTSKKPPCQEYRIEIHSEQIRAIPNHSEPIRKTFRISFDENRLNINPT